MNNKTRYQKPAVVEVLAATHSIQNHMHKPGVSTDSIAATASAYEADE